MNLTKIVLVSFLSVGLLVNCKQTASAPAEKELAETKESINPQNLEKASFTIEGMTCAIGCAKTIEKELAETNGVAKATVDFEKKEATVSFDKSTQSIESLAKIVEASADGETYKVSKMVAIK
jgi:mercuric ion binding protein